MKRAVLISGGVISDYEYIASLIKTDDFILCADSGIYHCTQMKKKADVIVGDFDSANRNHISEFALRNNAEVIELNPVKDYTDTEFGLDYLVERGYRDILLLGATGNRVDHMLSCIFLMEKYRKLNTRLIIADEKNILSYATDETVFLCRNDMKYVSILPLEDSCVSSEGLKYPMMRTELKRASSLGISNEYTGDDASLTIFCGSVLIVESRD